MLLPPLDTPQGHLQDFALVARRASLLCSSCSHKKIDSLDLTTLDYMLPTAQHGAPFCCQRIPMNKAWFQDRLQQLKLSQRKLAKLIDVDPAAVSYMFSGQRRMTMDEAQKIAGVLLVPVTEVMRQAGIDVLDDVRKVPIAGHINARGVVSLLPRGTHDMIVAPADVPAGGFAVQMRSVNSARDGWLYFVSGEQTPAAECLDRFCVVALKDGALLLAMVKRGYKRDLYNLVLMADGDPSVLENKEVTWGARVLWILPT